MKILIDTNILIDFYAKRQDYYNSALKIMSMCTEKQVIGCVAAHSITNIFFILRKYMSLETRRSMLKDLCKIVTVIGIDANKLVSALDNKNFFDVEDCLQMECAKEFSADYIVTRNIKDFKHSTIPVILPDVF